MNGRGRLVGRGGGIIWGPNSVLSPEYTGVVLVSSAARTAGAIRVANGRSGWVVRGRYGPRAPRARPRVREVPRRD